MRPRGVLSITRQDDPISASPRGMRAARTGAATNAGLADAGR